MKLTILLIATALLLANCGTDYKAEVESNTSWSGAFGNGTVDGNGDQTVDLPDDPPQCVVVQKQTASGYLKVRIVGERSLLPDKASKQASTTAEYGVVDACLD